MAAATYLKSVSAATAESRKLATGAHCCCESASVNAALPVTQDLLPSSPNRCCSPATRAPSTPSPTALTSIEAT